jgi:hypothetical protein
MQRHAEAEDLELLDHFTVLVYPFHHGVAGAARDARLEALDARWEPWWARLKDPELAGALEDTSFFLPYVRGVLFPETALLPDDPPEEDCADWVARARRWGDCGLRTFGRLVPPDSVLRLTCREPARAALSRFTLVPHRASAGRAEIPAHLDWVDAVLFPTGVGFLLLKVRLRAERPGLAALIDLNGGLRTLLRAPAPSWKLPVLRFAGGQGETRVRGLMDTLTAGMGQAPGSPVAPLVSLGPGGSGAGAGRGYGGACFVVSYACADLGGAAARRLGPGAFATAEDRVLFEYAACLGLGTSVHNPAWVPSEEQAERFRRENRLALWRCWKGMVLKESLVFLGTADLPYNRRALPHNVEGDYLPLYVFTLHQKFQLFTFANSLMGEVARPEGGLRGARELLGRYVAFRNRYWLSEVTQKPQGGELYRKLQQGLEVDRLHEAVTASVKGAKEYHEEIRDRQVRLALDLLALVFGPLLIVLGALRVFLAGAYPLWAKGLLLAALGSGAATALRLALKGRGVQSHSPAFGRATETPSPAQAEPPHILPGPGLGGGSHGGQRRAA